MLAQLTSLNEQVKQDLVAAGLPSRFPPSVEEKVLDVAIIGGGMSGMVVCLGLQKQGVFNVAIFDENSKGQEGPWLTSARMHVLRSKKDLPGPALGITSLTFSAWYKAQGKDRESLVKIPTDVWGGYLQWYREVLDLPIRNQWKLQAIEPEGELLKLTFSENRTLHTKKLILATGRAGFGGFEIPSYAKNLPRSAWFHTGEVIDPGAFQGKAICIVGSAASAFDVAAAALEAGAARVDMLMRRGEFPGTNPFAQFSDWASYYFLSDKERSSFFQKSRESGTEVPSESVERVSQWKNLQIHKETLVDHVEYENRVKISTNRGPFEADLLIFATGYAVDLSAIPELQLLADKILLWGDRVDNLPAKLARFPYLGPHFEFLEKTASSCPHLSQIHCFNYGAFLSHGRIAGDIDQIQIGVERLIQAFARSD